MKLKQRIALICLGTVALFNGAPGADAPFRANATPGTRHYRYMSSEQSEGRPPSGYRVDFDLATDASGGVTAIIIDAEEAKGDVWSTPTVSAECKAALHGNGRELARVTLAPITREAADSLGEAFMAMCAPAAYFFPMTDILNVSLIQTSAQFHLAELTSPGQSARFDGFETKLDRLGTRMEASSPGGTTQVSSLDDRSVTIDWAPDPMQLTLVTKGQDGQRR